MIPQDEIDGPAIACPREVSFKPSKGPLVVGEDVTLKLGRSEVGIISFAAPPSALWSLARHGNVVLDDDGRKAASSPQITMETPVVEDRQQLQPWTLKPATSGEI